MPEMKLMSNCVPEVEQLVAALAIGGGELATQRYL